jgi:hypothetical protein
MISSTNVSKEEAVVPKSFTRFSRDNYLDSSIVNTPKRQAIGGFDPKAFSENIKFNNFKRTLNRKSIR